MYVLYCEKEEDCKYEWVQKLKREFRFDLWMEIPQRQL